MERHRHASRQAAGELRARFAHLLHRVAQAQFTSRMADQAEPRTTSASGPKPSSPRRRGPSVFRIRREQDTGSPASQG